MKSSSKILKPRDVTFRPFNEVASRETKQTVDAMKMAEQTLRDAKKQARAIVSAAQSEAEKRMKQVEAFVEGQKERIERLKKEAVDTGFTDGKQQGYDAGYKAGHEQALQKLHDQIETLNETIAQIQKDRYSEIDRCRTELLALAVAIAEKLICRQLRDDTEYFSVVVDSIMETIDPKALTALRVCPKTFQRWQQKQNGAETIVDALDVTIVSDDQLQPGDVILDTTWGYVDGRLRKRWSRIVQGLNIAEACTHALEHK